MAGGAIARNAIMIEDRREERRRVMAEVTVLRGGHMVHCRILADGIDPVVTAGAVVGDTCVIKYPGGKTTGVMAHAAIFAGGDVRGRFAGGIGTVMTGCAVIHDTLVIKHCSRESAGHVANTTIFVGRQVCHTGPGQFVVLASGSQTTLDVTRITPGILYFGTIMIDVSISEVGSVMTDATILVGIGVRRRRRFTSGIDRFKTAIVTRNTIIRDTRVIEDRWSKH